MPHESLGDFLSILEDAGDVVRISAPVDSALEIAEITRRMGHHPDGGPALFFESVRDSLLPVVTNLLGSESRLCLALNVSTLDKLSNRLTQAGQAEGTSSWLEAFKLSPFGNQQPAFAPRVLKQAYCQQIVKLGRDVNLWELPIPRSWPEESHPVITLGQVVTRCPQTQRRSIELIPVQVTDQRQLVPCWHRHHSGYCHWKSIATTNQQLPISIALGGHATNPLMALATLPEAVDPVCFGGLLQGSPVELVKCRTNDLEVPAHAEIVIEGMIDPAAPLLSASPVALPTGFYSERTESLPAINVTAMTHRANPMFPAQIFHAPPSEETWMRRALERLFLPWIKTAAPEIVDWHFPVSGGGRNWLFVSIHKEYPLQARTVMHAMWGHPLSMLTKGIVIVDDTVNVRSSDAVWFAAGANVDPGRDLVIASGPTDVDDHAGPIAGAGHKLGIDATRKLPEERHPRTWPKELEMSDAIQRQVAERWTELGLPRREESAS